MDVIYQLISQRRPGAHDGRDQGEHRPHDVQRRPAIHELLDALLLMFAHDVIGRRRAQQSRLAGLGVELPISIGHDEERIRHDGQRADAGDGIARPFPVDERKKGLSVVIGHVGIACEDEERGRRRGCFARVVDLLPLLNERRRRCVQQSGHKAVGRPCDGTYLRSV